MDIIFETTAKLLSRLPYEWAEKAERFFLRLRMSRTEQVEFLMNYSKLRHDGILDKKALQALREEYLESMGPDSNEVKYCNIALEGLRDGFIGIDDAMNRWFDPDLAQVARTANVAKNGAEALDTLLKNIDEWRKVKVNILQKVLAPMQWVLLALSGTYIVATKGIRAVAGDVPKSEWTPLARFYDELGLFLTVYTTPIMFVLLVLIVCYCWSLFNYVGEQRTNLDKYVPGFGFYQAVQASKFFSIMAVLVSPKGGQLKLKQALEEFEENPDLMSKYLGEHISEMLEMSEKGKFSLEQLNTGLLPKRMRVRLGVAGKTSGGLTMTETFDSIAKNLASDYGSAMAKSLSKYLTVAKVVALFLLVGAIAASLDGVFTRIEMFV